MDQEKKKFDLEQRTACFGEAVIGLCQNIKITSITQPLIRQLIRSATSIGANYCEADCAESRKDFEHKIGICKKESKETRYWLRMLIKAVPDFRQDIDPLWKEANELNLIFSAIVKKSKSNQVIRN